MSSNCVFLTLTNFIVDAITRHELTNLMLLDNIPIREICYISKYHKSPIVFKDKSTILCMD